jgi:tRNA-dihydrouridine synthase B
VSSPISREQQTPFCFGNLRVPNRVILAPMSGITDAPFRRLVERLGAGLVVSEMTASEALVEGRRDALLRAEGQGSGIHVVQLAGCEPRWMAEGARIAEAAGAAVIDINMGCPAKHVANKQSGSALMRDLDHAMRLIEAAVEATSRPVTLKMRLGWDDATRNAAALAARAEAVGAKAITVHGRTRQQFYNGTADWSAVAEVKAATGLPVIVNGDVIDAASAREALTQSGADAIMIGRGAYGRPWIAAAIGRALKAGGAMEEPAAGARLDIALDHFADSLRFYGDVLGLKIFRKHLGWYVQNAPWPVGAEARRAAKSQLCRLRHPREVEGALTALWLGGEFPAAPVLQ